MAQEFKHGDKVEWNTPQGKTRGMVVISSPQKYTYPLMLSSLVREGNTVEYGPVMVGAAIGLLPLAVVFVLFQKYIVSGVFGGSLKE